MAIVVTVGADDANSFVTLAEASAYFEARPSASRWAAVGEGAQENALLWAAARLDEECWQGIRASDAQALAWPRRYANKPDSPSAAYYAEDEIPRRVKDAQCEIALMIIESGIENTSVGAGEFVSFSDGAISWTKQRASIAIYGASARSAIRRLLRPLLVRAEAYR